MGRNHERRHNPRCGRRHVAHDAMIARLVLKRVSISRSDGQWSDEDYDVLADGKVVGRIYEDATAAIRWFLVPRGIVQKMMVAGC
jgi:hypothetical protein